MISEKGESAAVLWVNLCVIQSTCALFGIETTDSLDLQLLEILGFIKTTETNEEIIIKVHGKENNGYISYFCGGKCGNHD